MIRMVSFDYHTMMQLCIIFCIAVIGSALSMGERPSVMVAGATGYIGRQVVRELVSRDISCIAMVRPSSDLPEKTRQCLEGAVIIECDPLDVQQTQEAYSKHAPVATVCCLASRSGVKRDSWAVDYGGGRNLILAQKLAAAQGSSAVQSQTRHHYTLLSAYCVGKPLLEYQHAKLKLEEELIATAELTHSIVRPTAFFKSLDGQLESAQNRRPLLHFGSGECAANAICAEDLARFLADCALAPDSIGMLNAVRDVGGPDNPPITKKQQLNLIYDTLSVPEEQRRIISLPVGIIDAVITGSSALARLAALLNTGSSNSGSNSSGGSGVFQERCEDAAEIARIVRYYATEPMVAVGEGQVHGTTRLADHFRRIAERGGTLEEIDRMTTTTGVLEVFSKNQYARQANASLISNNNSNNKSDDNDSSSSSRGESKSPQSREMTRQ